jgi:SAM-dependent methyltransferase
MMLYKLKLALLKILRFHLLYRRWLGWHGILVGDYGRIPEIIRRYAPGKSFADIGCMWGVNGEYSFVAAEAGATKVKAVDVFGPTPEFEAGQRNRAPAVEFVLGDVSLPEVMRRIGVVDVVFCAGVLYHHPSPFDVLVALRQICRETLILRTAAIPEIRGLRNAAIYYPMLPARDRRLWDLSSLGVRGQVGINDAFAPTQGYANFFWGFTPSCLESLLQTAGFSIEQRAHEPFAQTVICRVADVPFQHEVPDAQASREMGRAISAAGIARPQ